MYFYPLLNKSKSGEIRWSITCHCCNETEKYGRIAKWSNRGCALLHVQNGQGEVAATARSSPVQNQPNLIINIWSKGILFLSWNQAVLNRMSWGSVSLGGLYINVYSSQGIRKVMQIHMICSHLWSQKACDRTTQPYPILSSGLDCNSMFIRHLHYHSVLEDVRWLITKNPLRLSLSILVPFCS